MRSLLMRLLSYTPTVHPTVRPTGGAAPLAPAVASAPAAEAPAVGGVTSAASDLIARAKGWLSRLFGKATPPAAPIAEPTGGAAGTYTVQRGDTLSKIAQRTLGNGGRWKEIFDANRDQLNNPNLIYPGTVLKVPGQAPAPSAPAQGSGPLVRKGSKGDPVRRMQERLKELGHDPKGADGVFGPNTEAAVKAFQAAHGLATDGVVGPQTWGKLGIKVEGAVTHNTPSGHSGELIDMGPGKPKGVRRQGKIIGVNIAANFDAMVAAAARDGVQLRITSGYRSHAEQVHLWNLYQSGKGNIAARPGTSNHESGDAIDFTNTPGAWAWLKRNSTRFGFKNFAPEPWHYSPTGG
jgi:LysM repeat protein